MTTLQYLLAVWAIITFGTLAFCFNAGVDAYWAPIIGTVCLVVLVVIGWVML